MTHFAVACSSSYLRFVRGWPRLLDKDWPFQRYVTATELIRRTTLCWFFISIAWWQWWRDGFDGAFLLHQLLGPTFHSYSWITGVTSRLTVSDCATLYDIIWISICLPLLLPSVAKWSLPLNSMYFEGPCKSTLICNLLYGCQLLVNIDETHALVQNTLITVQWHCWDPILIGFWVL